ncbi:flagellar brake protein [Deferribacter thermophilus]|uniref:flagellar brake protein n=1 Tax=Deferribacter thermophilus TaxID=53573 RepID=UPI003C2551F6
MEKVSNPDRYIESNTKVLVEVLSGEFIGKYDSRIEAIDNDYIYISLPTKNAIPAPLKPETKIEVSFVTDKGRFSFISEVIERVRDNIIMLKIKKPNHLNRKELRKYFRVETHLKIIVYKIKYNENSNTPDMLKICKESIVKDISGGGVRILTDLELNVDDIVELDFAGTIDHIKEVFGKVVRRNELQNKLEAGIEFISIRENDRDKIIQYVFKRQIELKKMQS